MRIYKGNPELVFRGRVAPWYGALVPDEFTGHVAAASTDAVYIDAPIDGDAVVSVLGNDHLVTELRRRAGLDAPDVPSDGAE